MNTMAAVTLWLLTAGMGAPLGAHTAHAKPSIGGAISDVCHELVICCIADQRPLKPKQAGLPQRQAMRHAAGLVGVSYDTFKRLYDGVSPRPVVLEFQGA